MVKRKRFSKRQYRRTAERRGETVRGMRTIMIASAGIGEFKNDTQRSEIRRGQESKWQVLKQFSSRVYRMASQRAEDTKCSGNFQRDSGSTEIERLQKASRER
jgi:hypothetical protein